MSLIFIRCCHLDVSPRRTAKLHDPFNEARLLPFGSHDRAASPDVSVACFIFNCSIRVYIHGCLQLGFVKSPIYY
jgi:hypothetical protein